MRFRRIVLSAASLLFVATPAASQAPATWDGLVQVPSSKLGLVYLQPGADFRAYTKIQVDPTEVAFEKNWQRDYNRTHRSASGRVSDADMERAIKKAVAAADTIFANALAKGGYTVVNAPGPDVLRVRTGILNIRVTAPDIPVAGRQSTFAEEAGSATLFVEARDSLTNALLGRAVDQRVVGESMALWRTSSSNRADFRAVVSEWADATVRGLTELKARSPIQP